MLSWRASVRVRVGGQHEFRNGLGQVLAEKASSSWVKSFAIKILPVTD
jgi:hypothetical protein